MTRSDEADARHRHALSKASHRRKAVRAMKATLGNRKLPEWYLKPDGTKPEPRK